jgi:hypothetical protein
VWDATVFCKNRDRLLDGDIAAKFFTIVLNLPQVRHLLSSEHFSVDGTLIEAWASKKSFVPKGRWYSALRRWSRRERRAQRRAQLSRGETQERHAFLDHRCQSAANRDPLRSGRSPSGSVGVCMPQNRVGDSPVRVLAWAMAGRPAAPDSPAGQSRRIGEPLVSFAGQTDLPRVVHATA